MYQNGIRSYQKTNVTTADPKRLVLMCYEGAISNLKIAREKYAFKEYEAKAKAVQKAQEILTLLLQSLDFEKGGKIAVSLEALYNYMLRRLIDGDIKKDTKIIDEVIYLLEELESAWKEIFRTSENAGFISDTGQEKQAEAAGDY
ncbi:MAG: flagellar export chaperone FliS [Pseudomonadota bacterium]